MIFSFKHIWIETCASYIFSFFLTCFVTKKRSTSKRQSFWRSSRRCARNHTTSSGTLLVFLCMSFSCCFSFLLIPEGPKGGVNCKSFEGLPCDQEGFYTCSQYPPTIPGFQEIKHMIVENHEDDSYMTYPYFSQGVERVIAMIKKMENFFEKARNVYTEKKSGAKTCSATLHSRAREARSFADGLYLHIRIDRCLFDSLCRHLKWLINLDLIWNMKLY